MDPTSLSIKFTPLIRSIIDKENNCCLEIIPEVSNVKNLDKIQWKQIKDHIEYCIPITYKVIIRKLQKHYDIQYHNKDVQEKVYHSCVDLLRPSSSTNFASGDILRVPSDNVVLHSMAFQYSGDIIKKQENIREIIETSLNTGRVISYHPLKSESHTDIEKNIECENMSTKLNDGEVSNNVRVQCSENENISLDEDITNIENVNEKLVKHNTQNAKQKLTLSSICAISTEDYSTSLKTIGDKIASSFIHFHSSSNVLDEICDPCVSVRMSIYNQLDIEDLNSILRPQQNYHEPIITDYVNILQKEMLPLRIMLDEIIDKYRKVKVPYKKSEYLMKCNDYVGQRDETPLYQSEITKEISSQNVIKSNRVVYTVVFDG